LIPIDGIPVLEREICSLRDQGFKELILTVSHMGDKIMDYFGDGSGVSPATGEPLAGSGQMFCYDSPEYVKDMGTPERFYEVEADFIEGRVQSKNLSNRQKAVFLDRDGVINKYVGFLRDVDEFELLPGVSEAIKKINGSGYLCIVVTNQPVIARGEVTVEELDEIHNKMETLLGLESAYIDGLYYCPHHPHKGYEGEIPELKTDCDCRKPKPGMLLKAAEDFNIALAESWMVGDGENDVMAGRNAGCKTAFIRREETEVDADIIVNSLLEFVEEYL
jgi:D-glycero-D-manno-heptose 1,7-bisphosphate phosphatase